MLCNVLISRALRTTKLAQLTIKLRASAQGYQEILSKMREFTLGKLPMLY